MIWPKRLHRRLRCEIRIKAKRMVRQMLLRHGIRAFQPIMNRHGILRSGQDRVDLPLTMPGGWHATVIGNGISFAQDFEGPMRGRQPIEMQERQVLCLF